MLFYTDLRIFFLLHITAGSASPLSQQPLLGSTVDPFPVYWQNDTVCAANSSHFVGTVPVAQSRGLFFWFVESRDDPIASPTIIWLNGGPGASSLVGLFEEIGPCRMSTLSETLPNPHSWSEYANLLFLDQPSGTGLSASSSPVTTLHTASLDFSTFVKRFTRQYPQYFAKGLFIAGESFGGIYVPRFTSDIVQEQLSFREGALEVPIHGIILVDALVDGASSPLGHYEMFCTGEAEFPVHFNQSTCDAIAMAMPEAERLQHLCQSTQDPYVCSTSHEFGLNNIYRYLQEQEVDTRRRSPYDLRLPCGEDRFCIPKSPISIEHHLNRPEIQRRLGLRQPVEYVSINFSLNAAFTAHPENLIPTTREVTFLLDEGELSVLVMNGNFDAVM
ncbi:uncharacterized protein MYCFIDRAFT_34326 [Pseudocercospora fijiensis CIRAD86]|uniref:Carboxypeptidase n=1 Tax=Pseudocercospora fijiensis (strain CIRAD86) TaxID=383855 RepID=M2YMJ2_PSEFD|nr:uncharacterized protein MYCFIDRAFT_34326 [Pseudocercospora fijiensis CIRAD86]EME78965.1 hypothetical protein MYCFIDRAFT_34326 [Pseudocercospora fijiensis CIRAD86]